MFLDAYQAQRMQTNVRRHDTSDLTIPRCSPLAHICVRVRGQDEYAALGVVLHLYQPFQFNFLTV